MATSPIIRKTPTMKLKELEYGKEIDTLMLDALRESSGEYRTAANSIGISPAAFTRWIVELGLSLIHI